MPIAPRTYARVTCRIRSKPAVSQICNFTILPADLIVVILKSMPIVDNLLSYPSSTKESNKLDLPVSCVVNRGGRWGRGGGCVRRVVWWWRWEGHVMWRKLGWCWAIKHVEKRKDWKSDKNEETYNHLRGGGVWSKNHNQWCATLVITCVCGKRGIWG